MAPGMFNHMGSAQLVSLNSLVKLLRKLVPPYAPVPGTRMTGVLLRPPAQVLGKCMAPTSEACSTV